MKSLDLSSKDSSMKHSPHWEVISMSQKLTSKYKKHFFFLTLTLTSKSILLFYTWEVKRIAFDDSVPAWCFYVIRVCNKILDGGGFDEKSKCFNWAFLRHSVPGQIELRGWQTLSCLNSKPISTYEFLRSLNMLLSHWL